MSIIIYFIIIFCILYFIEMRKINEEEQKEITQRDKIHAQWKAENERASAINEEQWKT